MAIAATLALYFAWGKILADAEITNLKVSMAEKASKEWVLAVFFLALIAQFAGFSFIANLVVSPVRDDVVEIQQDLRTLRSAAVQIQATVSQVSDVVGQTNSLLAGSEFELANFGQELSKTGQVLDTFNALWSETPIVAKGDPEAVTRAFELYYNAISPEQQSELLDKFKLSSEN